MKVKNITIDTEIWREHPEKSGYLQYVGQRKAEEVFDEIKDYLEKIKLIPDEYFSLNYKLKGQDFPKYFQLVAYANYGSSEGIYLDIDLYTGDENGKTQIIHFATGKTLSTSDNAMNQMYRAACETVKAFGGHGKVYPRYVKTVQKGLSLSENEFSIITNSLIHLRNTLKSSNSEHYMVDGILNKLYGSENVKSACREEDNGIEI